MSITTGFAYLDESGDLGWKLNLPFQSGGSSQHFTIGIAAGKNRSYTRLGKVVDALHKQQKWTSVNEKKWATIGRHARENFCQLAVKELASNPEIVVMVAVLHKRNAPVFLKGVDIAQNHPNATPAEISLLEARYRGRTHLIYSTLVAGTLSEHLPMIDKFAYCPDDLNESQRTLEHILTYKLLIQEERVCELNRVERKGAMQRGLEFADMIAGAVFEAFEHGNSTYLDILRNQIKIKEFYPHPPQHVV